MGWDTSTSGGIVLLLTEDRAVTTAGGRWATVGLGNPLASPGVTELADNGALGGIDCVDGGGAVSEGETPEVLAGGGNATSSLSSRGASDPPSADAPRVELGAPKAGSATGDAGGIGIEPWPDAPGTLDVLGALTALEATGSVNLVGRTELELGAPKPGSAGATPTLPLGCSTTLGADDIADDIAGGIDGDPPVAAGVGVAGAGGVGLGSGKSGINHTIIA